MKILHKISVFATEIYSLYCVWWMCGCS